MEGAKIFIIGILVLAGVLYVAAVIIAMAPYLAIILIALVVCGVSGISAGIFTAIGSKGNPDPPD